MEHGSYRKNDIVTVTIEDIGNDGEGIGKSEGYTLFVKDAVIGDTVEARITKCKKNYGYARVEKVVTPSSFRVEPKCRFTGSAADARFRPCVMRDSLPIRRIRCGIT